MVARPGTYQASNNSGELKPELHGRTDLKQFYAGLAYARNIEPVPQGGSRLSPRTRHLGRARRRLIDIPLTYSGSDLNGHAGVVTLLQYEFGQVRELSVMAAINLRASNNLGGVLRFEYNDGATWLAYGPAFSAGHEAKTRTAASLPGAPVQAIAVRLQMFSPPGVVTDFALDGVKICSEGAALSLGRIVPFTFSLDQTYVAAFTNDHCDFYRDGVFIGGAYTGIAEDQIPAMTTQQRLDTMLAFHADVASLRILRDGSDQLWASDRLPFKNIPQVDLGGSYTNQVVDIWDVYLSYPVVAPSDPSIGRYNLGNAISVVFTVNGEVSSAVSNPDAGISPSVSPDWNAFCAAAKIAIEALPSIEPGVTVTISGTLNVLTITFGGADNLGSSNVLTAQVVNTGEAAATASHRQTGKAGGEDLFGPDRGYAACGQFYQDRLVTAGFKAKRGALMASVTGDYFNCNIDQVAASGAILNNLDTDGAERIHFIARSRHLVIFTSDAEYYISDRALSKTTTPTIVNSSRNGSAAGIGVVESEGSLIYVARNNALIYAATYDDVSTSYVSQPISLLASHIASNISGLALQKATNATDASRLWLPRLDGTLTLGTMLRGEAVTAFTRWETDGLVRSACVDGKNVAHLLVERVVNGVPELHFERLELGLIFDGAIEQTFGVATTHITGLSAHEGAVVWAVADGYVTGPFTVVSGAIELPYASRVVSVGRWTPLVAETLPLPSEVAERVVLRRPKRVHTVKLDLVDTTSVAVGANDQPACDVALARAGDPIDVPQAAVSRTITVEGLRGFSDEGKVRITQTKPGLCAWRGITIEART